jgi:hypothetical protein
MRVNMDDDKYTELLIGIADLREDMEAARDKYSDKSEELRANSRSFFIDDMIENKYEFHASITNNGYFILVLSKNKMSKRLLEVFNILGYFDMVLLGEIKVILRTDLIIEFEGLSMSVIPKILNITKELNIEMNLESVQQKYRKEFEYSAENMRILDELIIREKEESVPP